MNIQQMISRFSWCLLAWCLLAAASTFAQTITHVPLFTFDGDSAGVLFGDSVSGAGDVNGDGFDDLIVGAPNLFNDVVDTGIARVLSGVDGSVIYNFDGDLVNNFNGDLVSDGFGGSVSGAGDVNGDGFDDLIVGARSDDNNGSNAGSVRVFSGVDGSVLYAFNGDSASDRFGGSVSGAGDVNGDGFDDVIVGASGSSNGSSTGSARVFSGVDGSVLYNFFGGSRNGGFGFSVSGAGDVNGDGFADLIVGAALENNNGLSSGSARVFSGVDGSVLYIFDGDVAFQLFGEKVSGAGDVNGDGYADLIVGARNTDTNGTQSGRARVFSGIDGGVLYTFDGDVAFDNLGFSVSGAGDVNDDGFDDLIVGLRGPLVDPTRGSARVFSGSDGSILYNFEGDSSADAFGDSVSGAGDVNGDGVADFIVGADFGGANNGGYARVFVSQITPLLLGDCNQDGEVNFEDIPAFITILQAGAFLAEADVNQDDEVTFSDIPAFIAILAE